MKRLVFIVEGDTEILLLKGIVIPYLVEQGFFNPMTFQTITTNRKQHKKGGVPSYGKFTNEVSNTLAQGNVIVTTFIDFYKLPTDFPNFTTDSTLIDDIETGISSDFGNNPDFIPYIQRHELEALMFANRDGLDFVIDDPQQMQQVDAIIAAYPNPEDINNSPQTAPSKRLESIYNYDKTGDGELIFEMIGIDDILSTCPRFSNWMDKLIEKLSE